MTATKNRRQTAAGPNGPNLAGKVFAFLGSLRLAIFLLAFIGLVSISGTLIKQQASPEEYLAIFSPDAYRIIHRLGFDDVFHSWWFFLLVLVFALNLILCTYRRFAFLMKKPGFETAPSESFLRKSDHHFLLKGANLKETVHFFRGYRTMVLTEGYAILEKGRHVRYAVPIIHGSVLLILLGGLVGLHFGYRGSLALLVGESRDTVTLRDGQETKVPLGFAVKCMDFKADFYPNGQPREFVSTVEIREGDRVTVRKEIRVNKPLTYKGVSFYQATYGYYGSFQFAINGRNVELKEGDTFQEENLILMIVRYADSVHEFGPGIQVAYLDNGEPRTVWFLRDVPRLREQKLLGIPMKLTGIRQERYTGLEVSKDPGLWLVWSGFFLMLLGLSLNFGLSHRRLYLLVTESGLLIAGSSPGKNREGFRREFQRFKEKLHAE